MTKSASKTAARKAREANAKTASKGSGKARNKHHKTTPKLAAEMVRDTHRKIVAQFEPFRGLNCQTHCASLQNGM